MKLGDQQPDHIGFLSLKIILNVINLMLLIFLIDIFYLY